MQAGRMRGCGCGYRADVALHFAALYLPFRALFRNFHGLAAACVRHIHATSPDPWVPATITLHPVS